ncbi:MAG: ribosome maturation factor RimM [Bacteroidales bacterium]|nr:ribosome maturation factor RimM [Bacteroidales bacterium]
MEKTECYYLGRITKPFGYKGQMVLFLDVDDPSAYEDLDAALVETRNGMLVPYTFHVTNRNDNKAVVLFESLTAEEAHALAGHDVYLPLSMLPELKGNQFYFHEVEGFRVVDEEKGDIGILKTVIDYPAQALFQVMNGETEILVPVIPEVIQKVDRSERTLFISAPNGLIDLYMQDN